MPMESFVRVRCATKVVGIEKEKEYVITLEILEAFGCSVPCGLRCGHSGYMWCGCVFRVEGSLHGKREGYDTG